MEKTNLKLKFSISEETNSLLNVINIMLNANELFSETMCKIYGELQMDDILQAHYKAAEPLDDFIFRYLIYSIRENLHQNHNKGII